MPQFFRFPIFVLMLRDMVPELIHSFAETLRVRKNVKAFKVLVFADFFVFFFFFFFLNFHWRFRYDLSRIFTRVGASEEIFPFFYLSTPAPHLIQIWRRNSHRTRYVTLLIWGKRNFVKNPGSSGDVVVFNSQNQIFFLSGRLSASIVAGAFVKRNDEIQTGKK